MACTHIIDTNPISLSSTISISQPIFKLKYTYKMSPVKSSPLPINIPVILQLSRSEDISVADLPIVPQGLTTDSAHSLLFRKYTASTENQPSFYQNTLRLSLIAHSRPELFNKQSITTRSDIVLWFNTP